MRDQCSSAVEKWNEIIKLGRCTFLTHEFSFYFSSQTNYHCTPPLSCSIFTHVCALLCAHSSFLLILLLNAEMSLCSYRGSVKRVPSGAQAAVQAVCKGLHGHKRFG